MGVVDTVLILFTVSFCCCTEGLEPRVEPFKLCPGSSKTNCSKEIFNSDINGLSSLLTSNIYDTITHCSQYQFNVASEDTAQHCVDKPEVCGESSQLVTDGLKSKLREIAEFLQDFPRSCKEIAQKKTSPETGNHLIRAPNNSFIEVYCNFDFSFGNSKGWMRLINLDMSQSGAECPSGLWPYYFTGLSYPICDREHFNGAKCDSTTILTHGISYSSVVGRVRGYQTGGLDGIYQNNNGVPSLDSYYVDGVSITYGNPRQHIWTYIGGQGEGHAYWEDCPCNSGSTETLLSFVGSDYYCESGTYAPSSYTFYPKDPLWDGQGCDSLEATCCTNPNFPWFYKPLNVNVTSDIEFRMCSSEGYPDESTAVDQIEIYVQ